MTATGTYILLALASLCLCGMGIFIGAGATILLGYWASKRQPQKLEIDTEVLAEVLTERQQLEAAEQKARTVKSA